MGRRHLCMYPNFGPIKVHDADVVLVVEEEEEEEEEEDNTVTKGVS